MGSRAAKDEIYRLFAEIAKAAGNATRFEILDLLCQGEKTVETLAAETGQKIGNTSAHLRALRAARLVETRKDPPYVHYRIADPEVCGMLLSLRRLAERRLAEVREVVGRFYADPDGLEAVGREELIERARRGDVLLLDVRPEDEYVSGHLPGAYSIPLSELGRRLGELPRDQEIVAYCRGPYCMFSREAVALLRVHGYRAVRFDEGVIEWRAAGLPVESGDGSTGESLSAPTNVGGGEGR